MAIDIEPVEVVALYRIWTSIVYRCTRKNNKQYKNYGGRGIEICEAWKDFNRFCWDVGMRPFTGCHLDRIDNDKGYFKENCRWTTPKINHRNKRNNHYYQTHLGKICQSELIEKMGFTRAQFRRAKEKYGEKELLSMFSTNTLPPKRINPNLEDLIGKKIGNLTIISLDQNKSTGARYFCICDCGNPSRAARFRLLHGHSKWCKSCAKKGERNPRSSKRKIQSPITKETA